MPTNRELYFSFTKENNKYLNRMVVKTLLNEANGFTNDLDLYKNFDKECRQYNALSEAAERIRNGEPLQYVIGKANFIDKWFFVNECCLIPRPETEELVIDVKAIIETAFGKDASITIADIGTGSGVIGTSLALYFPKSQIYMTDIDQDCLDLAADNVGNLGASALLINGNMLDPFIEKGIKLDIIVSNPPYIDGPATIDEQVWKYEPHKALLASPDTKYYEEIIKNACLVLNKGGMLAFEIGELMEESLTEIIKKYMPKANFTFAKDMYGKTRFLFIVDIGV